jgi:hypothetical protein
VGEPYWKQRVMAEAAARRKNGGPDAGRPKFDDGYAGDGEPGREGAAPPPGYQFEAVDSAAFFAREYRLRWLARGVLAEGLPGVVGGPKKTLKTSTLVDLAVSLATGTPFLGHFKVFRRHRVLMVSGESGEATLWGTGRRVCRARGVEPASLGKQLHWSFRLPQLASPLDRGRFRDGLSGLGGAGVVALDPLYLCLLAGLDAREVEAGNLYHMGPLLLGLARDCLSAGWTPLLCHHARKHKDKDFEPMDLDDLSFAGIAEFARQWLLESRRAAYDPQAGTHRLWLSSGSSAFAGGLWGVDVGEGVPPDDGGEFVPLDSRRWDVRVGPAFEVRAEEAGRREREREDGRAHTVRGNGTKLLLAYDRLVEAGQHREGWVSVNLGRDEARLSGAAASAALNDLALERHVERDVVKVPTGRGLKSVKKAEAFRRPNHGQKG